MVKKILSVLVFLTFITFLGAQEVQNTSKKSTANNTVKVGWYYSAKFQEGLSDSEPKSGFCYEYLQKISDYNGWTYSFVYGEWTELFSKLETGEIDILAGVSKTKERQNTLIYPNYAMGNDYYYLFQHSDNKKIDPSDLSTFEGKKIGGVKDNRMTYFLENWAKENNVHFNMIYYDGLTERDQDFADYKLDGISATDNNIFSNSNYSPVINVGEEPFYLAVTKKRPDLLLQLNKALETIQQMDPYFLQNLQYQSYGTTTFNSHFSEEEQNWVKTHDTLKVGYLNNYLPFCTEDKNGNAYGLLTDVLDKAFEELGIKDSIKIQYTAYDTYEEMISAVKNDEVDTVFPVGGSNWEIDQDGMNFTTSVINCGMNLVYKGNYSQQDESSMAVNSKNKMQLYYTKLFFPNADIREYDSIEACADAVKKGEVNAVVINGLRTPIVRKNSRYNKLSIIQLEKNTNKYFGLNKGNAALLILLNRGIKLAGRDFGVNSSYKYMDDLYTYTSLDYFKDHQISIGILIIVIFLVVLLLFIRDAKLSKAKAHQEVELNKKLAKALKDTEAANKAKTTFLFNMSHDIRTPMNAIIGYTDLIQKNLSDEEKCLDYLTKLRTSSDFLLSLINNVLEVARIESGKSVLTETIFRSGEIGEQSEAVYSELFRKKNISFSKTVNIKSKYVYGDVVKLQQIFLNIVSNAYKYTNEGGAFSIRTVELPSPNPGYALMQTTFSDTGIGMSKEFQKEIFEEFTREHSTTDSKVAGTGLGMPIVKKLIELMNGTISVESELGKGSTFVVTIPLKIAQISDEITDSVEKSDNKTDINIFKGKRILLAEDNELNTEIATEILTSFGFVIEHAADGQICVDMLKTAEAGYYDLILMDIQMPNMNGYEAAKAIRSLEDESKAKIKILAMTANAFEEDRQNALNAGMNGHVAKPINVNDLLKELIKMI